MPDWKSDLKHVSIDEIQTLLDEKEELIVPLSHQIRVCYQNNPDDPVLKKLYHFIHYKHLLHKLQLPKKDKDIAYFGNALKTMLVAILFLIILMGLSVIITPSNADIGTYFLSFADNTRLPYAPFAIFFILASIYNLKHTLKSKVVKALISALSIAFIFIWALYFFLGSDSSSGNLSLNLILIIELTLITLIMLLMTKPYPALMIRLFRMMGMALTFLLWLGFIMIVLELAALQLISMFSNAPEIQFMIISANMLPLYEQFFSVISFVLLLIYASLLIYGLSFYKKYVHSKRKIDVYLNKKFLNTNH